MLGATIATPSSPVRWRRRLEGLPTLRVRTIADLGHGGLPLVEVLVSPGTDQPSALQIAARLRAGTHAIHVDSTNADQGLLMLVPTCLEIGDAAVIGTAFAAALAGGRLTVDP